MAFCRLLYTLKKRSNKIFKSLYSSKQVWYSSNQVWYSSTSRTLQYCSVTLVPIANKKRVYTQCIH